MQIKQHSKVKYLGYILYEAMSGEAMALSVINKINNKVKFRHWKSRPLTWLLCNTLVQPHFDYACSAWQLHQKNEKQDSNYQNKWIHFCLQLHRQDAQLPSLTDLESFSGFLMSLISLKVSHGIRDFSSRKYQNCTDMQYCTYLSFSPSCQYLFSLPLDAVR